MSRSEVKRNREEQGGAWRSSDGTLTKENDGNSGWRSVDGLSIHATIPKAGLAA